MADIVLTSDASLMIRMDASPIKSLFVTMPNTVIPLPLYKRICKPLEVNDEGIPSRGTTALRTVEAIINNSNLQKYNTKIVSPNHLKAQINENTKIVGISAEDPLGISPATVQFTSLFGGEAINYIMFNKLMNNIKKLKRKFDFKVVFGGPGAWEFRSQALAEHYGVDYIFRGEAEPVLPSFFTEIIENPDEIESYEVIGKPAKPEEVPKLLGPVNTKIIEISRGCGRGCKFCPEGPIGKMRSFPLEKILHDARLHVDVGYKAITLQSEDALRYGSSNFLTDWEILSNLIEELYGIGVRDINFTSATFTSFYNDPDLIKRLTEKLNRFSKKENVIQVGLETASTRLMEMHFANKGSPLFGPSEWPEVILGAIEVMKENSWLPVSTVILGLPGEEKEDVVDTLRLLKKLDRSWGFFIPFFYVPMRIYSPSEWNRFIMDNMTWYHWTLFEELLKYNVEVLDSLSSHPTFGRNSFYHHMNLINRMKPLRSMLYKFLRFGLFRLYRKKSIK